MNAGFIHFVVVFPQKSINTQIRVCASLLIPLFFLVMALQVEANGVDHLNLTSEQISRLREAVADNDIVAIQMLGMLYITGQGVEKNMERGTALIQRAADLGLARSQLLIAMMYHTGRGAYKKNIIKSLAWAKMAKSQGLAEATDYYKYVASECSPDELRRGEELYRKLAAAE